MSFDGKVQWLGAPSCLTQQEVAAIAKCYISPTSPGCADLLKKAGLPLCYAPAVAPLPLCLDAEMAAELSYCAKYGSTGPNPETNATCWLLSKDPVLFDALKSVKPCGSKPAGPVAASTTSWGWIIGGVVLAGVAAVVMLGKGGAAARENPGPLVVLWRKGDRLGSRPLAELPQLREKFRMTLIQRDASGTEHWEVRGENPRGPRRSRGAMPSLYGSQHERLGDAPRGQGQPLPYGDWITEVARVMEESGHGRDYAMTNKAFFRQLYAGGYTPAQVIEAMGGDY